MTSYKQISKPIVYIDMLYDIMKHIHYRSRPEEQDEEWLEEAIQNAEEMSAQLASLGDGISKSFFYDLTYHAVNRRLSLNDFYCVLKLYNIVLY